MKTKLAQAPTEGAARPLPLATPRALAARGWRRRLGQGLGLLGLVACRSILGVLLVAAIPTLW